MKVSSKELHLGQVLLPFQEFFRLQAAGGILLIACTVLALAWANSPWSGTYDTLWHTELRAGLGTWSIAKPLHVWINDGLMAIFFFAVGLEIKREILVGELATAKKAMLPIAAAVGGMVVPAVIYFALNAGKPGANGWGIPMATDIAFALGVLALLGDRVCLSVKIFLTALAIVDDIGAVLVIALFYTAEVSFPALGMGAVFLAALIIANRSGVHNPLVYTVLGIGLWAAFLKSGVHPTVAGVIIAMTIPARQQISDADFLTRSRNILNEFREVSERGGRMIASESQRKAAAALNRASQFVQTPLQRIEHELHPWVTLFIMPLFALANAGVNISMGLSEALSDRISLGIILGLVMGKQIGITLFAWLAVKTGLAALPADIAWKDIYAAGCLGGIGFTMSLFIANLAFDGTPFLTVSKVGILIASLIAGAMGWALFRSTKACKRALMNTG
jgi:NhaA family Na+:H+ antiporter